MGQKRSQVRSQEAFTDSAGELHERLWSWRREEPGASFDEIMERVRQEREAMMRPLLEELVGEAGEVEVDACCPVCGERAQNKGKKVKRVQHREGTVAVKREYYYCPACKQGFFPPGSENRAEEVELEPGDGEAGVTACGRDSLL